MKRAPSDPPAVPALKGCRDCKHVWEGSSHEIFCLHPQSYRYLPDYYRGEMRPQARSVYLMRSFGECKAEALLFESKLAEYDEKT